MTEEKTSKSWYKKWWAIILFIILGLIIIGSFGDSDATDVAKEQQTIEDEQIVNNETGTTEQVIEEEKTELVPVVGETVSQKNAVKKAKSYLDFSAFSYAGLIEQLEYEQFSHIDSVYGADNSGADWNDQAAKKAQSYMEFSAFSRGGLIEQLTYEGFTQSQAEYGASVVGL